MSGIKVMQPAKLAHVVLQTPKFDQMRAFYKTFLGAHVSFENEHMSFLTYDEEHHRIALIRNNDAASKNIHAAGLMHVAFTFDTPEDLCEAYKQRKAAGTEPKWCVNHGPTMSMYYMDPDGNQLETQVDSCTADEANAMMDSPEFAENPIGADVDPEELCRHVAGGEDRQDLLKRPNVGPRGTEDIQKIMQRFTPVPIAV